MFNSSILHLYTGKNYDLNEKLEPKYIVMNLLIPFLLIYIPTMFLKKITSIREFIYEQNYTFAIVVNAYESKRLSLPQT